MNSRNLWSAEVGETHEESGVSRAVIDLRSDILNPSVFEEFAGV